MHWKWLCGGAIVVVSLVGCGGGDADSEGGDEGAPCTDGTNCLQGLVCVVKTADPTSGVCTQPPSACAGAPDCQCLDELGAECTTGTHCFGSSGHYAFACNQDVYRLEGETCSAVRLCDTGLFCFIQREGSPGACTKLPDACATGPSCDCLDGVRQSCTSGSRCSVSGDKGSITCH